MNDGHLAGGRCRGGRPQATAVGLAVRLWMAAINPRNSMMSKLENEEVEVACMYTIAVSRVHRQCYVKNWIHK